MLLKLKYYWNVSDASTKSQDKFLHLSIPTSKVLVISLNFQNRNFLRLLSVDGTK